jgi:hypothetical protein
VEGLRFFGRLRRCLRGDGGSGRFLEQRQQGHRASRSLDPRSILAYLLGLLLQSGLLFLDLLKLPGFRVLTSQPGEPGLDVVPILPPGFERLDDLGVLPLQPGDSGFIDAGILVRQEIPKRIDGDLPCGRRTLGPFPHAFVDVEPQKRAEHAAPVSRLRFEEPRELALRQYHGLHERGGLEPQDLDYLIGCRANLVRQGLEGVASVALLQSNHVRTVAPEGPRDAVAARTNVEIQHHADPVQGRRDHLGPILNIDAGDLSIERKDDRVQQGRLAGSRRPRDGKEVERAEVDLLLVPEAREAFDGEVDGTQRLILHGCLVVEVLECFQNGPVRFVLVRAEMVGAEVSHRRHPFFQPDFWRLLGLG